MLIFFLKLLSSFVESNAKKFKYVKMTLGDKNAIRLLFEWAWKKDWLC